ncbi:FAD-binding oxidoreductase [Buchnera aphidicola]|uniref:Flavodoxin/ferredoxin--NADP reductase n=1 Tax=Buchnera aphidicola (Sarucallis kahawaluokalani) TaxID=1241878 RepID=A0A4D6YDP2_9GAMM|nr:FAD-binding oxidoreductase [Buchnera aphidicola]QCI26173.1 ferredoxin--NADP(+) reductase [Buchnera aphidicola (Sarucallis kahawaluokalani)]
MTKWVNAIVIKNHKYTDRLFKLILHAPISPFYAGQFAKLGIKISPTKYIKKVYSFVNPPNNKNLEFFITLIHDGIMSNKLYHLMLGEQLLISKTSSGFFTINEIPPCEILWMFATGTAIGPFCSILQDGSGLQKFKTIILIYAVKYTNELVYLPLLHNTKKKYPNKKIIIQTITSREKNLQSLYGRIPELLKTKKIEKNVGYIIHPNTSHVMLCGNPGMVKDTQSILIKEYNLQKHLRRKPGHISSENYW